MTHFKASIRVVKSLVSISDTNSNNRLFGFDCVEVLYEPHIIADSKEGVKTFLAEKYPQFFPYNRVYERETKDTAQFFYVIISELSLYNIELIKAGSWKCKNCGTEYVNRYVNRPKITYKLGGTTEFCDDTCFNEFIIANDIGDDISYVNKDSENYIYKITQKSTGMCYIGKTKNFPFFRWWNHFKHSKNPFGEILRTTSLLDWTFEVLEVLPCTLNEADVKLVESRYIIEHNAIEAGFNCLVSNKDAI